MSQLKVKAKYYLRDIFSKNLDINLQNEGFKNYLSCLNGDFVLWNLLRTGQFTEEDIEAYLKSVVEGKPLNKKEKYAQAVVHMVDLKSVSMKHLYDKMMDTSDLEHMVDQFGYIMPGNISLRNALSGVINNDCNVVKLGGYCITFIQYDMTITYDDLVELLQSVYKQHGYFVNVCHLDSRDVFENDFFVNPGVLSEDAPDEFFCLMEDMYTSFRSDDCTRREWDLNTVVKAELDYPAIYEVTCKSYNYLVNFKYARERMPLDINGLALKAVQNRMMESYLGKNWESIEVYHRAKHDDEIKERWFDIADLMDGCNGVYDAQTEVLIYRGGSCKPFLIMPKGKVLARPFLSMVFKGAVRLAQMPFVLSIVQRIADMLYMSQEYGHTMEQMIKGIMNRLGGSAPEWLVQLVIDIMSTRVAPFRAVLELPQVLIPQDYIITTRMKDYICALPNMEIVELVKAEGVDELFDTQLFAKIEEEDRVEIVDMIQNIANMIDENVDVAPNIFMESGDLLYLQDNEIGEGTITIGNNEMMNLEYMDWVRSRGCFDEDNSWNYVFLAPGYREYLRSEKLARFEPGFYGLKFVGEKVFVRTKSHYSLIDKFIGGVFFKERCSVAYRHGESLYVYAPYTSRGKRVQIMGEILWTKDYDVCSGVDHWYNGRLLEVMTNFKKIKKERRSTRFEEQFTVVDWDAQEREEWD